MATSADFHAMKDMVFQTAKMLKKFEKSMKWECSCGVTLDNDTNYCGECGLKRGDSAQPIAPAAPKAKGRPRKAPTDAVAPKAKGRPKKEVVKQETEIKVKAEKEESDGEPAAKRYNGRKDQVPDPSDVVLGYVKGQRTLNSEGSCVNCTSGSTNKVSHDYSCPKSRLFCPFGRMPPPTAKDSWRVRRPFFC